MGVGWGGEGAVWEAQSIPLIAFYLFANRFEPVCVIFGCLYCKLLTLIHLAYINPPRLH